MSKPEKMAARRRGEISGRRNGPAPVRIDLTAVRFSLWSMFVFSFVGGGISALGAIFVIQIYDRVLPSHSISTLVALAFIFLIFYFFHGVLAAIGGRLGARTGLVLVDSHEPTFLRLAQRLRRSGTPRQEATAPLFDFREVVSAIRGRLLSSLFDLAWVPILIVILGFVSLYMAAFAIGLITLYCAAAFFASNEEQHRDGRHQELWRVSLSRENLLFAPPPRLGRLVFESLSRERLTDLAFRDRDRDLRGVAVALREVGHSGILVVGAWLVLTDAMSIGAMMASSMLMMRILGPVQAASRDIASIRSAHHAWQRLKLVDLGAAVAVGPSKEDVSVGGLQVSHLSLSPPKSEVKLGNTSFSLSRGQCLLVTGSSGVGKSLLLKRLCGIVGSKPGAIQIGDEALASIDDERLSRVIGYVPEDHVFPPGTLLEIISKFDAGRSREDIVGITKRLGVHEAIMALEQGYETIIAPGEVPLPSALLRQIAFARAIVDQPAILLIDNPFRGMAAESSRRFVEIVAALKSEGAIVVIAMPELAATEVADFAMVLENQRVLAFGSIAEVLALPHVRLPARDYSFAKRGGTSP